MQTTGGLRRGLLPIQPGAAITRYHAPAGVGGNKELPKFTRIQSAHDAGERLFRPAYEFTLEKQMNALGRSMSFGHRADHLFERLHRRPGGEDFGELCLASVGVSFNLS